jgi:hypothetical protein
MTSSVLMQDQAPRIPFVKGYRSRGRWYFYLRPPAHLSALDGIPLGHPEAEARAGAERLIAPTLPLRLRVRAPAREMAAEIKDRGRRTRSSGGQSIG